MALSGRHRRYQPNRINRASLTVTAGGAGLALPLIAAGTAAGTATGADARTGTEAGSHAGPRADTRDDAPGRALDASAHDVRPQTTPQSRAGRTTMYTVVHGDTLSGIADEQHVPGGWRKLYAANRATVGADPDLILPGERLGLHPAKAPAGPATATKAPAKAAKAPTKAAETAKSAKSAKKKPTSHPAKPKVHHQSKSIVAPVHAAIGTGYRVAGPYWSKGYHTGVDFLVPTGTAVHAAEAGEVVAAGWGGSYGYQVVIRHADGHYTQYGHLSAISVRVGQRVAAGARIARSGATGNVTGPHLHFEVRTGPGFGTDIDPLAYLRARGVRI
ncbi:M23 family metallopeptidase [Streptomyces murinus]|uniref:Murein DD-endopeptidase MepM/ murein hydrolase activator NlpD n=1 Tax=Streptomyces murinus TaxID=33900 RepID=A0A7W3NVX3_STRMR|nr:peptidoglycan DD-metalloendopeptidase family protein [Streptomyces murinus]MBA9057622.1 murein DD-endopeptidase MepM/ murein hydrolase activator NlpD [Streptomyces murinus]UWW91885.1 peptidoglycan DD-metalloendopeptidase family protein [Streptomyces murinus]